MNLKRAGVFTSTVAGCVLGCGSALAAPLSEQGSSYLGAGIGYSDYTFWQGPTVQPGEDRTVTTEDSALAYSFSFGYHIADNIALELFYLDFGDGYTIDSFNQQIGADTFTYHDKIIGNFYGYGLAGKAYLPFGDKLTFYGKLGYMAWDAEFTITASEYENGVLESGPTKTPAQAFDDSDPFLAVGGEFQILDNLTLFADISYLHASHKDENFHTYAYTAGVRWQFKASSNWRSANKRAEGDSRGLTACQDEYKDTMGGVACQAK